MKLISPYYQYVRDGEKKYEIRINDEKRKLFQIGDVIQIIFDDKIGNIYIDKVPTKNDMHPCDILTSESQERMFIVSTKNTQWILQ